VEFVGDLYEKITAVSNKQKRNTVGTSSIAGSSYCSSAKKSRLNISLMNDRASSLLHSLADAKEALAKAQTKIADIDMERQSLDMKLETISKCKKFVSEHPTWSRDKIICLVPEFKDVIDDIMND
jgi:chromosome segregation ATPase